MAIWILSGTLFDGRGAACLVDSVSETALGPLFADRALADEFLQWLRRGGRSDPRRLSPRELARLQTRFLHELAELAAGIPNAINEDHNV